MSKIVSLLSGLALSACSTFGIRTTAEPPYRTLAMVGDVEIRSYAPRLAADTVVDGDDETARSVGFRRLAGFIFGGNRAQASIAMTAPVAQAQAGSSTIAMTAPVAQARDATGRWRIRFFMPDKYTRETLPQPLDPKVEIVTVPEERVAVLRFSGIPSATAVSKAQDALLRALQGGAWHPTGTPFAWYYDPPWTLPPLRRNEAVVTVAQ